MLLLLNTGRRQVTEHITLLMIYSAHALVLTEYTMELK